MKNHITYCGWTGTVEFSEEDGVLHGKLLGTKDLISYEGETVADLVRDFHESVDEYLDFCMRNNKPLQPRDEADITVKLEIYRQIVENAQQSGLPFEDFLEASLLHGMSQLKAS